MDEQDNNMTAQKQGGWTPGPWTKVRGELVGSNGATVVEYGSGVAIMCGGPDAESVANAALRNAAPDLYEALAEYDLAFAEFDPESAKSRSRMRMAVIKARAALSRANPSTDQGEG